jgi:mRNA deadenylase 3'-5' endonuclease subunit Ccr4
MHRSIENQEPYYTCCTHDFCGAIDYVFFSPGFEAIQAFPLEINNGHDNPLPSETWGSDHLPVGGRLLYTKPVKLSCYTVSETFFHFPILDDDPTK